MAAKGKVRRVDCKTSQARDWDQLSPADFNRVADRLERLAPDDWQAQLPAGAANMFKDSYHFVDGGAGQPMPTDQQAIADFLAALAQKR